MFMCRFWFIYQLKLEPSWFLHTKTKYNLFWCVDIPCQLLLMFFRIISPIIIDTYNAWSERFSTICLIWSHAITLHLAVINPHWERERESSSSWPNLLPKVAIGEHPHVYELVRKYQGKTLLGRRKKERTLAGGTWLAVLKIYENIYGSDSMSFVSTNCPPPDSYPKFFSLPNSD